MDLLEETCSIIIKDVMFIEAIHNIEGTGPYIIKILKKISVSEERNAYLYIHMYCFSRSVNFYIYIAKDLKK